LQVHELRQHQRLQLNWCESTRRTAGSRRVGRMTETSYYGVSCVGCRENIPPGHYQGGLEDRKGNFYVLDPRVIRCPECKTEYEYLQRDLVTFEAPEMPLFSM